MTRFSRAFAAVTLAAATITTPAFAAVITSLPGGTSVAIPAANIATNGPQTFGPFTFTSNAIATSLFGSTATYDFGNNGTWSGTTPFIGLNEASNLPYINGGSYGTMTLSLNAPTSGFLAEINWNPSETGGFTAYMEILDSNENSIEYFPLTTNNGGNNANGISPGYYGFLRPTADIKYVRFHNAFIAARNISYIAPQTAVPEPATWALMIFGFAGTGIVLRRREKTAKTAIA